MKKEKSLFLKKAYESGRVKDLADAFIDFPVIDEWHKGKVENVVSECSQSYLLNYSVGDIVFVKNYLYSDGKIGNNHLFVIIDQDNTVVPIENFGMLISSNLCKLKFDYNMYLEKDNLNNLHCDSLVKTDVIYKITNEQILFKIGRVDDSKLEEYKKSFFDLIK